MLTIIHKDGGLLLQSGVVEKRRDESDEQPILERAQAQAADPGTRPRLFGRLARF